MTDGGHISEMIKEPCSVPVAGANISCNVWHEEDCTVEQPLHLVHYMALQVGIIVVCLTAGLCVLKEYFLRFMLSEI